MEYDIDQIGNLMRYYKKGTGMLHREDGPAVELANGDKRWYINDKLHREDGPAVDHIYEKRWYINGNLHREGGPAVECVSGHKEWWINGKRLSEEKEQLMNMWWDNKNGI